MMSRSKTLLAAAAVTLGGLGSAAHCADNTQPNPFTNLRFRNLGPAGSGGRVTAVRGISGRPGIYYVGTAAGGLWKTTDDGTSWNQVFRHGRSASIGAVALAPSNPKDVWVGTGESNPRNDVTSGHGVYFSPDGGNTWRFRGLAAAGQVSRIAVNPTDPNIVFVAVLGDLWKPGRNRGVYMTTDGGHHWKKVLYVDDTTGASDIAVDPKNPNVIFAGLWTFQRKPWTFVNGSDRGGIWRSLDGGRTWKKLTKGLPPGPTNRVAIAFAPSDPNDVYVLMATHRGLLWGSDDMGDHWRLISANHALDVRPFYSSTLAVSPADPHKLYFGAFHLMVSTDGGKTAHVLDEAVHVDHHAIWIDPENPDRIIQGNDGGAFETLNGGKTWRQFDSIPIEQAYAVAIRDTQPFSICGGLQDNNSACGPSNSMDPHGIFASDWWDPIGGDGQYIVPAPSDPSIVYAERQNAYIVRLDARTMTTQPIRPYAPGARDIPVSKLKYRFNWSSPIAVSPVDADTVYLGGNVVFKSTDGGRSWQPISGDLTRNDKAHQTIAGGPVNHDISGAENFDTILSMSIAPTDPKVIWLGTDDGLVWVTKDGGDHWRNVTPSLPRSARLGRVYQIGGSPFEAGSAFLTVDAHMLGDPHPYVFKTPNYGRSWQRIDRGLPSGHPAFVVREDPNRRGLLALGTDIGLYVSWNDGRNWTRVTANLPATPVWDLKFTRHPHDLVLATHGRGFWVFDNLQPIEQWAPEIAKSNFHLFAVSSGTEWDKYYGHHLGEPPSRYVAPNPPSGPEISYYLNAGTTNGEAMAQAAESGSKGKGSSRPAIIITDDAGNEVATFQGSGRKGINRIAWNMRYDGAHLPGFIGGATPATPPAKPTGPLVLPGTYHVRVTVAGESTHETLQVHEDPRVHTPAQERRAVLAKGLELRNDAHAMADMLSQLHAMLGTVSQTISDTSKASTGSTRARVHDAAVRLKRRLSQFAFQFYNPRLQYNVPDVLHYITRSGMQLFETYGTVARMRSNQVLAAAQVRRIDRLEKQFSNQLAEYNGPLRQAVKTYNRQAYNAGLETLPLGSAITVKALHLP